MDEKLRINRMDALLAAAANDGVDAALEAHGEAINGREAAALKKLTPQEISTFNAINNKISSLARSGKGNVEDWTCGALC